MYCHHCGAQLHDGAKFCGECGNKVLTSTPRPITGTLIITRLAGNVPLSTPSEIRVDGITRYFFHDGERINAELPQGEHEITIKHQGELINSQIVDIVAGKTKEIVFSIKSAQSHVNPVPVPPVPDNRSITYPDSFVASGRVCPKCGAQMTIQTVTEERNAGCFTILLYILLAITILGLLIVIPLALRKKTETVTYAVCQRCGCYMSLSRR